MAPDGVVSTYTIWVGEKLGWQYGVSGKVLHDISGRLGHHQTERQVTHRVQLL